MSGKEHVRGNNQCARPLAMMMEHFGISAGIHQPGPGFWTEKYLFENIGLIGWVYHNMEMEERSKTYGFFYLIKKIDNCWLLHSILIPIGARVPGAKDMVMGWVQKK